MSASDNGRRPISFRAVPIVDATTEFEILSLDCWQDKVVIGCREGSLRVFARPAPNSLQFVPVLAKADFATRPVEFLCVIDALDLVISISDSVCYLHDLSSFALLGTLDTGGSRCFFVAANESARMRIADNPQHPFLLAVLSRSRLHVFEWKGLQKRFQLVSGFNLSDRVTTVQFIHNAALCLAYRTRFEVLYLDTGRSHEFAIQSPEILIPTALYRRSKSPKKVRGIVSEAVGNRRGNSVKLAIGIYPGASLYTFPANNSALPIQNPISIAFEPSIVSLLLLPPFLLVATSSGIHPVNIDYDQGHSQLIVLENCFSVRSKSKTMAFAASPNSLFFLQRLSIEEQIDELCSLTNFDAALIVLRDLSETEEIDDLERRLRYVNSLYAKHLFEQGKYASALKRFQQSNIDPRLVLSMYSELDDESLSAETISSIIPYLLHLRNSIPRQFEVDKAADFAALIDTFLLKMYLKADRRLVIPFLTQSHCCDIDSAEKALLDAREYEALLFLFKSRGLHQKSLLLLRRLHDQPESGFGGIQHTIAYLRQLLEDPTNWPLIQEMSFWVLKTDPVQSVRIFTDQYRRASVLDLERKGQRIRAREILHFLQETASNECCVLFLESLLDSTGNSEPEFHNALANFYLKMIFERQPVDQVSVRIRMQDFLMKSRHYDPAALLEGFPADLRVLPKERAILLHKCSRSKEALSVLARFDNPITAIEFCDTYQSPDLQLHMMLLRVFLDPQADELLLEPALQMLQTHTVFVDAPEAIALFPESLPVYKLQHFFEKMICLNLQMHRRYQVELQLYRSENRKEHLALNSLLQKSIVVDGRGRCIRCHQAISSTTTVVARTPNGSLIDYNCCVDPVINDRLP